MNRWVEIAFDCLPLRSVGSCEVPADASPKFRALCEQVQAAIHKHGVHNTYFLHRASCVFHLLNDDVLGRIEFRFSGVVLTDADDRRTERADLQVELASETCDWLTEPVVQWFVETVCRAVLVEFDRYIDAGDLEQAKRRIERIQQSSDQHGGYLGMYL